MVDNVVEPLHMTVDMEKNVYSQSGEDGIIEKVMEVLGSHEPGTICIEIGANDGFFCSNTAYLREKGWYTLLIEQDSTFTEKLKDIQGATPIIAEVTPENVVDTVFGWGQAPNCDVLSCDTDGDDVVLVTELLRAKLRPRILVIEYNPTYPPFLYKLNTRGRKQGSSIKAVLDELGKFGYDCVYATISNVILVDTFVNRGRIRPMNAFEAFRWDDVRFVCSDFDGQNHFATMSEIVESVVNPWDRLPSANIRQYPDRILGFSKSRAKLRASYNHYGE